MGNKIIPSFLGLPNSLAFPLFGFPVLVLGNSNMPRVSVFLAFGFFGLY